MVWSSSVPWYDRPARPFPAKEWLKRRYPFRVPRSAFARATVWAASDGGARRPFPALIWLAARQQQSG